MASEFCGVGYSIISEHLPRPLYRSFAVQPKRFCATLQKAIMQSRYEQWLTVSGHNKVAFDRSIEEDVFVFCQLHYRLGYIDDAELQHLSALSQELMAKMPTPDIIIYMTCRKDVISKRIRADGRPEFISTNIDMQIKLYQEWIDSQNREIVTIDNSRCRKESIRQLIAGA